MASEERAKEFILAFRDSNKSINKLNTFTEFEFNKDALGMVNQSYQDFKVNIFEKPVML